MVAVRSWLWHREVVECLTFAGASYDDEDIRLPSRLPLSAPATDPGGTSDGVTMTDFPHALATWCTNQAPSLRAAPIDCEFGYLSD